MNEGPRALSLGLFILFLSLVLWLSTASFVGWLVLSIPGACYVVTGCSRIFRDY